MYTLNQVKMLVPWGRDPARSLPLWRGFLLIPLILVCFAFAPQTRAQGGGTCLDGCDTNFGTFQGDNALISNGSVGAGNTAFGWRSLFSNSTANFNTAVGGGALAFNNGESNTAVGAAALALNTDGIENCAFGADALVFNGFGVSGFGVSGADFNNAFGAFALFKNSDGFSNNAFGDAALEQNLHGALNTAFGDLALENNGVSGSTKASANTAVGAQALFTNDDGDSNNAVGFNALGANVSGSQNNAMGFDALGSNADGLANTAMGDSAFADNVSGQFNTVIGWQAGGGVEGSDNIYIGATAGLPGGGSESGNIRIGDPGFINACFIAGIASSVVTGDTVVVTSDGQLGVAAAGSPLSANELLKERQVVQRLKATTEKQAARIALQENQAEKQAAKIALQENQIQTLTAVLKQQAEQIQKVSAQLEMIRRAPRVVNNQ